MGFNRQVFSADGGDWWRVTMNYSVRPNVNRLALQTRPLQTLLPFTCRLPPMVITCWVLTTENNHEEIN
jgi:hypothetical protein